MGIFMVISLMFLGQTPASQPIQDQLGLRLEAGKEPIPFLVVESAVRKPE